MSAIVQGGPVEWSASVDKDGYTDYKVKFLVSATVADGPSNIITAIGLPQAGDLWNFGAEYNLYAYCKQDTTVTLHPDPKLPGELWIVEKKFSTKPDEDKCKDEAITDPLLEPQKVSGGFSKITEEATYDRFRRPLLNSAQEQLRGAQVEFDGNRPSIKISQNVPDLQLFLIATYADCVNLYPIWGMPARFVKLSNVSWERKFYGRCYVYYTRNFEFEINYDSWDRKLLDEGKKALHGQWNQSTGAWDLININGAPPNRFDPTHFDDFLDKKHNLSHVILDGFGKPYVPASSLSFPTKWWCLNNSTTQSVFNGTCTQAINAANFMIGTTYISGPFETQADATAICDRYHTAADGKLAADVDCTLVGSSPGTIVIQKYRAVDFLNLRVPASF